MKRYVKFFFAAMLCLCISQNEVQGQGLKGVFNKVKGAVTDVAGKIGGKNSKATEAEPSNGPAKATVTDVKNSISDIRAYTGLREADFAAKMKSKGFVEGINDIGLDGTVYKSKTGGYYLAVKYGTRGKDSFVRQITKATYTTKPNFVALKTSFLDLAKQSTDLKTKLASASIQIKGKIFNKVNAKNPTDRVSKFLPAFDDFVNNKEEGNVFERYTENDYDYCMSYSYLKINTSVIITVIIVDKTIESQEG